MAFPVPAEERGLPAWKNATPYVLYEDAELLAIAKPAGLVTHPAYKHPDGTLCDAIFARQATRGEQRPWLLHRLDRETSGVVLFAKTEQARRALVRQFERHLIRKCYLALIAGVLMPETGAIDAPLARDPADRRRAIVTPGGQPALTHYHVLAARDDHALVLVEPVTGRTHQIRVHLASARAPLIGDRRYLPDETSAGLLADRSMLHAWRITLRYPGTGAPLTITAPLSADFAALARRLGLASALALLGSSSSSFIPHQEAPCS